MKRLFAVALACLAAAGCVPPNRDDGFRARKPLGSVPADTGSAIQPDTTSVSSAPDQAPFGFSVELAGPAVLDFTDEDGRHTGPATAEEYLPVLEAALRNPALHEQERAGLERMRDQIRRSGSAAGMAVTRRIPNLDYRAGEGTALATFRGAETLDMRLVPSEYAVFKLTIRMWDKERVRTAVYSFSSGPGQEGGMDINALIDDLTLSWDTDGDGEPDRDIAPAKAEVARRQ